MRRPDDALLLDMLEYGRRVADKVHGVSREQFDADDNLQLALTYLIQTIGEAASRLTQAQRNTYPTIPWRDVIGMRHVVVHDYFRVDLDVVWDTATTGVPALVAALEAIIPPEARPH